MKVATTPEEIAFVAEAGKDYYEAAAAVDAFKTVIFKILHEITDDFKAKLVGLGLPFDDATATERSEFHPPSIQRKTVQPQLEAGLTVQWLAKDEAEGHDAKRLCVYWWIWLKNSTLRQKLCSYIKADIRRPCIWESGDAGSSCVSLYCSLLESWSRKTGGQQMHSRVYSGPERAQVPANYEPVKKG